MSDLHFVHDYCHFFETLTQKTSKEDYGKFFDDNSTFEDPFQKVQGLDAIYNVFEHMYHTLESPYFVIDETIIQDNIAYLKWDFIYYKNIKSTRQSFTGVSRVEFCYDEKVKSHVDYWDSASAVYEKIPLLKTLLKFIKKRIQA